VHADLFRDNTLFENDQVSAVFDFYFAAQDTWLFDLAVCLNDWAMDPLSAQPNDSLFLALVQAYQSIRPLTQPERSLMGAMLRSAALRFWLSRLWDLHAPRDASLLNPHDPTQFERVLRHRIAQLSGSPGLAFL
jgi:homoserine kinase type II